MYLTVSDAVLEERLLVLVQLTQFHRPPEYNDNIVSEDVSSSSIARPRSKAHHHASAVACVVRNI
jgi:hypothetical protein